MKIIAITQRVQVLPDINERRDCLSQEWYALAQQCGFMPIALPNDISLVQRLLKLMPISGFILSGGNDLASLGGDAPERDQVEHMLLDYAIAQQKPLLGVCRGMQILLEHFGASLHKVEGHVKTRHTLNDGATVNSFHNYAATSCTYPLIPLLWTDKHVIEAVQHGDYPWLCGLMWHPERENPMQPRDIYLIKELFGL